MSPLQKDKSVVTCDLEGRIQTFNPGAERIFGYSAGEAIGKLRVSAFSPGLIVLGHVGQWLATAKKEGEMTTRTVFLRKDGTSFAAEIKITPTHQHGEHIGYCGVTTVLEDVPVEAAMPPISIATRIFAALVVTRAPFLTAVVVPVLVGAALVASRLHAGDGPFPWSHFALVLAGAIALHVAANTFNDYFDWQSGTDQANHDYFMPFSGGSRAIELGLVRHRTLLFIGVASFAVAALAGVALLVTRGTGILFLGGLGAASAFFYTAPPLRLVARKGLGELLVGLSFGPLVVAGCTFALTGTWTTTDLLVGIPVGVLTTAILFINEFPDAASDASTGKNHLVVVLGKERARWAYVALLVLAFGSCVALIAMGLLPMWAALMLAPAPLAARAAVVAVRHFGDRELVRASSGTIQVHALAGILLAIGILASSS
jgi:1,4-dihydroxy-2-naphthoate octaprenyltransferase